MDDDDAAAVIEATLRSTVSRGTVYWVRPMSDDELARDIVIALNEAGFRIVRVAATGLID